MITGLLHSNQSEHFKIFMHIFSEYDLAIIRSINYRQNIMNVHIEKAEEKCYVDLKFYDMYIRTHSSSFISASSSSSCSVTLTRKCTWINRTFIIHGTIFHRKTSLFLNAYECREKKLDEHFSEKQLVDGVWWTRCNGVSDWANRDSFSVVYMNVTSHGHVFVKKNCLNDIFSSFTVLSNHIIYVIN